MAKSSARPADEIEETVNRYADTLYRICLMQLKNPADAEDAVQTVFLKLLQKRPAFESEAHEKAWLIRVAVNACRDAQRQRLRHPETALDETLPAETEPTGSPVLEALQKVPEPFRIVLTLHYIEGYSVAEIAPIIGKTKSAVKMRLQKGRKLLEEIYRRENME